MQEARIYTPLQTETVPNKGEYTFGPMSTRAEKGPGLPNPNHTVTSTSGYVDTNFDPPAELKDLESSILGKQNMTKDGKDGISTGQ